MKIKNFQEVKISEFLPETTKIYIPKEQGNVIEHCVRKFGSEQKLADHLGISRSRVNDWKFERSRIDFGYYVKMKELLSHKIQSELQFQTHKRSKLKTNKIKLSPEISWLIGIRDGDRDEDEYCVGVGASYPEIIIEFMRILENHFKLKKDEFYCSVTVPKYKINEKDRQETRKKYSRILGLPKDTIRVYPKDKAGKHKLYHVTLRYYNKLVKDFFNNFEEWFKGNVNKFDKYTQCGYVKGLIDSEGTVYDSGRTVIAMKSTAYEILAFTSEILKEMNIRFNLIKCDNFDRSKLTIYGPAYKLLELCCPVHDNKRNKMLKAPSVLGRARVPQQRLTEHGVF